MIENNTCYQQYTGSSGNRDTDGNKLSSRTIKLSNLGGPNEDFTYQLGGFNDDFWNKDTSYRNSNNCYAYACNIRISQGHYRNFPHPGYKPHCKIPTIDTLLDGIKEDGIIKIEKDMKLPSHGTKENPIWLAALLSGVIPDSEGLNVFGYHWYRVIQKDTKTCWGNKNHADPANIAKLNGKELEFNGTASESENNLQTHTQSLGLKTVKWHGYFLIPGNISISGYRW
ncbi:hypothetical protein [Xenorhabdus szentirmaii]|uniref:Uncharacterized protein n=1 Tax=Xenorhabdus szentirmaii DSM 16338 TaxID=1427518 RepID=W1J630_9GAMM|nr:hypothetical protein [Xenorhabdus szentirmaii]PHM35559.1 hypothetical protein Xsze_02032 [Xenorhabdus szentirmaii DSM 16338]PHM44380.1 hypothetical protein Xszus_04211 [Xenorhabdus szentirmaii]CDL84900.1 hypothetical protein XSR1_570003 [Xenorhabdus szentirmaii DSM 16338]